MNQRTKLIIYSVVLGLLLLSSSLFTVHEGQKAMVLRFGEILKDSKGNPKIYSPGLHAKVPLINQVKWFDTRLQTMDIQSSRIVTIEKKNVIADYYVKWRIQNLPLYFTRTSGDVLKAQMLLEQQLNDSLRAQFGQRTVSEVVSDERTIIMDALLKQANLAAKDLGITVLDVRIKKIDLPEEVSNAIYEQMRTERAKVAAEHRANGQAEAEAIRAKADAESVIIVATAKAKASQLKGDGDGEAARIYGDAYNKDPNFYAFYRSLDAYKETFSTKDDLLLLKPNSGFFKYFKNQDNQGTTKSR